MYGQSAKLPTNIRSVTLERETSYTSLSRSATGHAQAIGLSIHASSTCLSRRSTMQRQTTILASLLPTMLSGAECPRLNG